MQPKNHLTWHKQYYGVWTRDGNDDIILIIMKRPRNYIFWCSSTIPFSTYMLNILNPVIKMNVLRKRDVWHQERSGKPCCKQGGGRWRRWGEDRYLDNGQHNFFVISPLLHGHFLSSSQGEFSLNSLWGYTSGGGGSAQLFSHSNGLAAKAECQSRHGWGDSIFTPIFLMNFLAQYSFSKCLNISY